MISFKLHGSMYISEGKNLRKVSIKDQLNELI